MPPAFTPPFGTSQRIRNRAIWAVALFTASVPPAVVALGVAEVTQDQLNVALPLAIGFWLIGLLFALWAAFPTLRYWEALPQTTRWLGALPMLSVSLFFSAALIAVTVRLKEGGRKRTEQGDATGAPPPYPAACGAGVLVSWARHFWRESPSRSEPASQSSRPEDLRIARPSAHLPDCWRR